MPGPSTNRYGGNTSCVEVRPHGALPIIIDAGTGLRPLGKALMAADGGEGGGEAGDLLPRFAEGRAEGHILVSHTHWDHVQGLPFFAPFRVAGNRFHIYARERHDDKMQAVFASQTDDVYLPAPLTKFRADLSFRELRDDSDFMIGTARVRCARLNHPWIAMAYRIDCDGASLVYCSDTAPFRDVLLEYDFVKEAPVPGAPLDAKVAARLADMQAQLVALMQGADLLIYDTQFTRQEYALRPHWGHSTPSDALQMARLGKVKTLCLFHHAPLRSDDEQDAILQATRAESAAAGDAFAVIAAQEGQEIALGGQP